MASAKLWNLIRSALSCRERKRETSQRCKLKYEMKLKRENVFENIKNIGITRSIHIMGHFEPKSCKKWKIIVSWQVFLFQNWMMFFQSNNIFGLALFFILNSPQEIPLAENLQQPLLFGLKNEVNPKGYCPCYHINGF